MLIKREKHNLDGDIGLIPLGDLKFAIVDAADYPEISKYKWHCRKKHSSSYAARKTHKNGKEIVIWLHRQIMGFPKGKDVHHSNRNPFDDRRCNLIPCTRETHRRLHGWA